jgi:hypothetical protein
MSNPDLYLQDAQVVMYSYVICGGAFTTNAEQNAMCRCHGSDAHIVPDYWNIRSMYVRVISGNLNMKMGRGMKIAVFWVVAP